MSKSQKNITFSNFDSPTIQEIESFLKKTGRKFSPFVKYLLRKEIEHENTRKT